jgi:hypothetical protein
MAIEEKQLTVMRVVPECARLIRDAELVQERMAGRDRALVDAHRTVSPVGTFLEQTMPMLCIY